MKLNRSILAAALLAFTGSALALTVPVLQDSTATNGQFAKGAGGAATLSVNGRQAAYIQFDLGNLAVVPLSIDATNIVSANLRIYVGKAKVPGNLELHAVTDGWSEATKGTAPAIDPAVIKTFPANQVSTKDFVVVDVTDYVKEVYTNGFDAGLAITADSPTKVTLGSKEGAASGYPCELNIETNYGGGGVGSSPTFDSIVTGAFTADGPSGTFGLTTDFGSSNNTVLLGEFDGKNGNGPQVRFKEVGGASFTDIGQDGSNNFVIETDDVARLTITPAGNVGIGTTAPEDPLHLAGTGDTRMTISTSGTGVAGLRTRNSLHEYYIGNVPGTSAWSLFDNTAGAFRLMVLSSGDVGVGTGAPAAKLDVRGDVKLGATGQLFAASGEQNLRIIRGLVNTVGGLVNGAGYTVARTPGGAPAGDYTITYGTAFADTATVTANPVNTGGSFSAMVFLAAAGSARIQIFSGGNLTDCNFNFIAVGTR